MTITVYGVFRDQQAVTTAVSRLQEQGLSPAAMSLISPHQTGALSSQSSAGEHPVGGTIVAGALGVLAGLGNVLVPGIGGLLAAGPLMAALQGVTAQTEQDQLQAALIHAGMAEDVAVHCRQRIQEGQSLLAVHVEDATADHVRGVLEQAGALEVGRG